MLYRNKSWNFWDEEKKKVPVRWNARKDWNNRPTLCHLNIQIFYVVHVGTKEQPRDDYIQFSVPLMNSYRLNRLIVTGIAEFLCNKRWPIDTIFKNKHWFESKIWKTLRQSPIKSSDTRPLASAPLWHWALCHTVKFADILMPLTRFLPFKRQFHTEPSSKPFYSTVSRLSRHLTVCSLYAANSGFFCLKWMGKNKTVDRKTEKYHNSYLLWCKRLWSGDNVRSHVRAPSQMRQPVINPFYPLLHKHIKERGRQREKKEKHTLV